jgi:hypothetical protein
MKEEEDDDEQTSNVRPRANVSRGKKILLFGSVMRGLSRALSDPLWRIAMMSTMHRDV